jgi:hypothetical protein
MKPAKVSYSMRYSLFAIRPRASVLGAVLLAALVEQSAAAPAIPDFSGTWGRNVFNLEPMSSGPGPLANLKRVGKDAAMPITIGDPVPLVGDYMNPILKPEAAAVVKQKGEYSASGHDFPDPSNQCAVYSPPFLFTIQLGMQMLQLKDEIVIIYTNDDQVRHIRLNERHPAKVTPTQTGHSVGHYEGNELVIDTVGIKLQPYTVADRFGTPQSDAMHVVERYRLIDANKAAEALSQQENIAGRVGGDTGVAPIDTDYGKALEVMLTIDDPKVFTMPWSAKVSYRRVKRAFNESVCAENQTDVLHQGFEHAPQATRPDF